MLQSDGDPIGFVLRVDHGFEAVAEHGQVLEGVEDFEDVFKRYKEATDKQEGNDEDWNEGHNNTSVREEGRQNEPECGGHEGAELEGEDGLEEDTGGVVKVDGEVGDNHEEKDSE